jgi:hypothetical protein
MYKDITTDVQRHNNGTREEQIGIKDGDVRQNGN